MNGKDNSLAIFGVLILIIVGLMIGLVLGLNAGLRSRLVCEVVQPSIIMDTPGHLPPLDQQVPVGIGMKLQLVKVVDGYALVWLDGDVEGYLPIAACRVSK